MCHSNPFSTKILLQPMPDFTNLSLQEHGGGTGVADDPYGTHSSRPSFYGGCGYSREYWRNLAGPDYHRGGAKLSPGSVPRHGPSSPRHASPGGTCSTTIFLMQKNFSTNVGLHTRTIFILQKKVTFQPMFAHRSSQLVFLAPPCIRQRISRYLFNYHP